MEINTDAWASSQIASKLWLCEELEKVVEDQEKSITVLGGWYGILSFLLFSRNNMNITDIQSFDLDPLAKPVAMKINKLWEIEGKFQAHTLNVNELYPNTDIVINTSTEHIHGDEWFDNIPLNALIAFQSTNQKHDDHFFCVDNIGELIAKYPLTRLQYFGEREFVYPDYSFKRFMIIGLK